MPLELFRNRNFAGANILTVLLYAALAASLFLLPFLLIEQHGYSATAAGGAFLPFSIIMGLGSRRSGSLVGRFGPRLPLMIGPLVTGAGLMLLGLSGQNPSYWAGFLPGLTITGIGMTLSVAPLTTTVLNAAPDDRSGTASGINNAAARVGGLLAVAALGLAFGPTGAAAVRCSAPRCVSCGDVRGRRRRRPRCAGGSADDRERSARILRIRRLTGEIPRRAERTASRTGDWRRSAPCCRSGHRAARLRRDRIRRGRAHGSRG